MTLSLIDITHRFGDVTAVREASLEAAAGEIVCLFGASGCGKTTLLRIAAGLEPLQAGEVRIDGARIAAPGRATPPEKRAIGFVFQDYVLFPHMTAAQNVAFGVSGSGRAAREKAGEELAAVGLAGFEKRFPHELSGGQQQRVAIARALARRPRALLLDEPFASIDAVLRRRLREDLRRLLKARGVAVVLVTHDPEEALALGDRIALMRAGAIVETASPEGLFKAPRTPEGAGIFPECQRLEGEIRDGFIRTAFGQAPAAGRADGPGVAIIRAGAASASLDPAGSLQVVDVRFAGPDWRVYLGADDKGEALRVAASSPPEPGARMRVEFDPAGVFVFSAGPR
ncbi:MAG: ABC transporter ATP-binding protein [Pseudomonadota bacterium]